MAVDARRRLTTVVVAAAAALAGCGGGEEPIKVGVLTECTGPFASLQDAMVAATELPWLERSAQLRGKNPLDGIRGARVAGRDVELLPGCTEFTQFAQLIAETRRLVDAGADVVVGPLGDPEGIVQSRIAKRFPDVTFVLGWGVAQAATLQEGAPNVFRFVADGAQTVAGLGTYAFRDLGWRRAAVVSEDFPAGWETAAGFVSEFCALGGRIVRRTNLGDPRTTVAAAKGADGVALLSTITDPAPHLAALALAGDLPRRVVGGGPAFAWPTPLKVPGAAGTTVAYDVPPRSSSPAWRKWVTAFHEAFPSLPRAAAVDPLNLHLGIAMEAVAQGLEGAHGDVGDLPKALAQLRLDAPPGPIHLDDHGQAVVDIHLERLTADGGRAPLRLVKGVEETFGGAFTRATPEPSSASPRCVKRTPPPWAG